MLRADGCSEAPRSSVVSSDKVNSAQPGEEETTSSPVASGPVPGRELELLEDSTEELIDALSGRRANSKRLSAGPERPNSSEEPEEVAEPALPSEEDQEPGLDADS